MPSPPIVAAIAPVFVTLALIAVSARAETNLKPGIFGDDNRQPVDNSVRPWTAIGHVNIGGYHTRGICTGTLIAPRVVLTAAHCVINPASKALFPMKSIHFVAGVRKDRSLGQSVAKCVKFADDFHYTGPARLLPDLPFQRASFASFKLDLAIVVLAEDIPGAAAIDILEHGDTAVGTALIHPSYPADRRYMLTGDRSCKVVWRNSGIMATDCDTHPGSSGGPVVIEDAGSPKLAAVMVGIVEGKASIAIPLDAWPGIPLNAQCP